MALQELIYTSLASREETAVDVSSILKTSERNNVSAGITGLLLFDGERYIQILEGLPDRVNTLFETIQSDPRHDQIELLHKGEVVERAFENWRMAYEVLPEGLLKHLAETVAVFSLEIEGEAKASSESFGARLYGMFMDAVTDI